MNIAVNPVHSRDALAVAIVGAGPYGLAAAGNIRSISAARAPTWKPSSKTKSKSWPAAS
jgi:NADH dehydrogenase FAD-containing subunit